MSKTGVLLINLGTPDDPTPDSVGRYLREFLMDPLVIDIPKPLRWILVHALIVPRRKFASAVLYQKIWTPQGSPLLVHTRELYEGVRSKLSAKLAQNEIAIDWGMRYGAPSLEPAVQRLLDQGCTEILAVPLYPQYSLAATQSSLDEVQRVLAKLAKEPVKLSWRRDFFDAPEFIDPMARQIDRALKEAESVGRPFDFLLFSYHGLPERHLIKGEASLGHPDRICLCPSSGDYACCGQAPSPARGCYRAQCLRTTQLIAEKLGLAPDFYSTSFQSRLGRTPWIKPFSDAFYRELPTRPNHAVRRLAVVCPSFVADCLETLEEVAIRGDEEFKLSGGTQLSLIPCLNADSEWVHSLSQWITAPRA